MAGYILLPFEIQKSKFWEPGRPRTKLEALIDLTILSQSEETISERKLAERWKWPKTKVHRFIIELQKSDHLLDHNLDQKRTTLRLTELELLVITETKKEPPKRPPERPLKKPTKDEDKPVKIAYAEYVFLTEKEYESLKADYGETDLRWMIDTLNNYLGYNEKKRKEYASHNYVIRGWIKDKLAEEKKKQQQTSKPTYTQPKLDGSDDRII